MRLTKGSLPLLIMSYITSGGPYWRASAAGEYFARLSPQHFAHGHCGTGACRHSTCTACLSKLGVEGGTCRRWFLPVCFSHIAKFCSNTVDGQIQLGFWWKKVKLSLQTFIPASPLHQPYAMLFLNMVNTLSLPHGPAEAASVGSNSLRCCGPPILEFLCMQDLVVDGDWVENPAEYATHKIIKWWVFCIFKGWLSQ